MTKEKKQTEEQNKIEEKTTFRLTIESDYPPEKLKQLELNGMRVTKNDPNEKELVFRSQDPLQLILSNKDHKCSQNELIPNLVRHGFKYNNSDYKVFHVFDSEKYHMVLDAHSNPAGIMKVGECSLNQVKIASSNALGMSKQISSNEVPNSLSLPHTDSILLDTCFDVQVTALNCKISYYPYYDLSKNYILNIKDLALSCEENATGIVQTLSISHNETLHNITSDKNSTTSEGKINSWDNFFIFSLLSFGAAAVTVAINNTFGGDDNDDHGGGGPGDGKKGFSHSIPPVNPKIFQSIRIKNLSKVDAYTSKKPFFWLKDSPDYCEIQLYNKDPDKFKIYCLSVNEDLSNLPEQEFIQLQHDFNLMDHMPIQGCQPNWHPYC